MTKVKVKHFDAKDPDILLSSALSVRDFCHLTLRKEAKIRLHPLSCPGPNWWRFILDFKRYPGTFQVSRSHLVWWNLIELLDYLRFLCIMYSVFCVWFFQLDTSVISSTWNCSIGSGPSNRERAKLEVLLSGISCQPSTSDHSSTITSLPLHQRANSPDLWESLSPTQHRVQNSVQYEQATIGGSYLSIFLPQCFCQKKRIHWKRTVQLGILACSALLLWVWLLRAAALHWDSYPSWSDQSHGGKTASCFQMLFMQLSVLSKAVLLGNVETDLTTQIPTAAAWWRLHKLPPSVCERNDFGVVCVCVCLKSFKCLAIQPLITCVVDSIVYLLYTSTCDSVNDSHHLEGLRNTPKKVEATVVWIVWNTG